MAEGRRHDLDRVPLLGVSLRMKLCEQRDKEMRGSKIPLGNEFRPCDVRI